MAHEIVPIRFRVTIALSLVGWRLYDSQRCGLRGNVELRKAFRQVRRGVADDLVRANHQWKNVRSLP